MLELKENEVLVLRTCDANMRSYGGFQWPKKGYVEAPDWDNEPKCRGGLHGLPKGVGDASYLDVDSPNWVVVKVCMADGYLEFNQKCKFRRGEVVFVGSRDDAVAMLKTHYPGQPVVFCTATAGYRGTATAGYRGTATAGYRGTATAGDRGTATAGDCGTATAGDRGTATAGYRGTATAGDRGTATAGYRGTATAGDCGTATAGDCGTATAGYRGTATAGYRGTATAGDRGTATAGDRGTATAGMEGIISILYYDAQAQKYRRAAAVVGGEKIKPNTPYKYIDGEFVEVRKNEQE